MPKPRNDPYDPMPRPLSRADIPHKLLDNIKPIIAHYIKAEQGIKLESYPHLNLRPSKAAVIALALDWFTHLLLNPNRPLSRMPRIPNNRCPQCGSNKVVCTTCKRAYRTRKSRKAPYIKPKPKEEPK